MRDYTCEVCLTLNRVGDVPSDVTGFRCGGCGRLISLTTGAAARARSAKPEDKEMAKVLAQKFWDSDVSKSARSNGGVCDCCNTPVVQGDGFLTGPLTAADMTPSLFCGSCFDSQAREPWDRDLSRMSSSHALLWRPVAIDQPASVTKSPAAPQTVSSAAETEEDEMQPKILIQQNDNHCVSTVVGAVPVITTVAEHGYMWEFEVAFAVNFLRAGCPGVQFAGKRKEAVADAMKNAQIIFDQLALSGETLCVTSKGQTLFATRQI